MQKAAQRESVTINHLTPDQRESLDAAIFHIRSAQESLAALRLDFANYLIDMAMLELSVELGAIRCETIVREGVDPLIESISRAIRNSVGE